MGRKRQMKIKSSLGLEPSALSGGSTTRNVVAGPMMALAKNLVIMPRQTPAVIRASCNSITIPS